MGESIKAIKIEPNGTIGYINPDDLKPMANKLEGHELEGLGYRGHRLGMVIERNPSGTPNAVATEVYRYLSLQFLVLPEMTLSGTAYLVDFTARAGVTPEIWALIQQEITAKKEKTPPPEVGAYIAGLEEGSKDIVIKIVGGLFSIELIKADVARYGSVRST